MDYKSFGKTIRKKRKALNLTQEKLAERANISFAFVGHIERGTRIPSLETVVKIADALDCSVDDLLGRYRGMPPMDERAREIMRLINRIILDEA